MEIARQQAKPSSAGNSTAPPRGAVLQRRREAPNGHDLEAGSEMDPALRRTMEQHFRRDLSDVRIHTGSPADQSARQANARAYTVGRHIIFGQGNYAPDSRPGKQLLAHELAHVIQQRGGGGGMPGASHEREAEMASRAVAAGLTAEVRQSSAVGLAARPAQSDACESKLFGRSIEDRDELTRRMRRILSLPAYRYTYYYASRSYDVSRQVLESTQWRSEEERLLYLRAVIQTSLMPDRPGSWEESQKLGYHPPGDEVVIAGMVDYEIARIKAQAYKVVPDLPQSCPVESSEPDRFGLVVDWRQLARDRERGEFESYLAEIAAVRDLDEQDSRKPRVYSGAATVGMYESYVGTPVKAVAQGIVQMDTRQMVSLMMNFIPIVGQIKGVAEALIGRDLITGDELPAWERGLTLLLSIIPQARAIYSSGRTGMKTLARVAVKSSSSAEDIYLTTKVVSKLTVAEVKAAEKIVVGGSPTAAQLNLAAKLEDLPGAGRAARRAEKPAGTAVKDATAVKPPPKSTPGPAVEKPSRRPSKTGGDNDVVASRALPDGDVIKITKDRRIWICSNPCDEFAEAYSRVLSKNSGMARELDTIRVMTDQAAQKEAIAALRARANLAPITEPGYLAMDAPYRSVIGGKVARGNTLKLDPADWQHIRESHVKATFDATKRVGKPKSTVFKGTPAQYLEILEEAVKNKAVVRQLSAGSEEVKLIVRGQEWTLKIDLKQGAIKTFHASGKIANPRLFEIR